MRILGIVGCIALAVGLAAPALGQASYQKLYADRMGAFFWDAATLKRIGDQIELDILQVRGPANGKTLEGDITRYAILCPWNAIGGVLASSTLDAQGKVTSSSGPEPFTQMMFYGPHGWQAAVAPPVCDASRPAVQGLTVAEAMAAGRAALEAQAATPKAAPNRGPAPPALRDPARFSIIREEVESGNIAFLDWSRLARAGDRALAHVFMALGDDTPAPPEIQWKFSVFAEYTVELNCKARTAAIVGFVTFTKHLEQGFADATPWPVRTAADWTLGAQLLDAACAGVEPERTLPTRAAAIAYQRLKHPLKTGG